MRTTVSIYYKGKPVEFKIPKQGKLLASLELKSVSSSRQDNAEEIKKALSNPTQCPDIAKLATRGKAVVIIVDDATRATPSRLILAFLLEELERAEVGREKISIVIARGCHRSPTRQELVSKLGKNILDKIRVIVHDPDEDLVYLGKTSRGTPVWINETVARADVRIGIGSIKSHTFAGYSGGPKIILPGVSGRKSIVNNHALFRSSDSRACKLDGNPVWEDMLEVAKMAQLDMKIDTVLDLRKEIASVRAGEVESAQKGCVTVYNDLYRVKVPKPADIAIVGGYPMEVNLLQSMVGAYNASMVTKDGGTIIVASACSNGIGGEGIYQALKRRLEPEEIVEAIGRGEISPTGGPMANRVRTIMETKRIIVVTDGVSRGQIEELGLEYADSLDKAIQKVFRKINHAEVIVQPLALALPFVETSK